MAAGDSFIVELTYPTSRGAGEGKSKLLAPGSALHAFIVDARARLTAAGFHFDVRPPHVEVTKERVDDGTFAALSRELHGASAPRAVSWMGKALVINMPSVTGYPRPHATIAYFMDGHGGRAADIERIAMG